MRPTRVLYVENDPALLGVMSTVLAGASAVEVILATADPLEVLGSELVSAADVALIDLALGSDTLTGVDLALALRNRNANIGIVIHSQHPMRALSKRIPADQQMGWSFLAKSGTLTATELVDILTSTAAGASHVNLSPDDEEGLADGVDLGALTSAQRVAMSLAAIGLSAPEIADQMMISPGSVRQHLSKAYKTLVPETTIGSDVRTKAVLSFVALTQSAARNDL